MSRRKDGRPRPTPDLSSLSDHDRGVVEEFAAALAKPTKHQTAIALARMDDGNPEIAEVLAKHDARCCKDCGTHSTPHRGCILR